jgi:hypothetical protein
MIRVNRDRWNGIKNESAKWKISAHEIFRKLYDQGLSLAHDDEYQLSKSIVSSAFGSLEDLRRRLTLLQDGTFDTLDKGTCAKHAEADITLVPPLLVLTSTNNLTNPSPCIHRGATQIFECDHTKMACTANLEYGGQEYTLTILLLSDGNFVLTNSRYKSSIKFIKRKN